MPHIFWSRVLNSGVTRTQEQQNDGDLHTCDYSEHSEDKESV